MQTRRCKWYGSLAAVLALWGGPLCDAAPMGSAFTYDGRLMEGGVPAHGSYDFSFKLYDAPVDGLRAGSEMPGLAAVPVENGLFTVTLDFGPLAFDGAARWLQIGVKPSGSLAEPALLSPRQALRPTPYALYAGQAATATVAGSVPWSAITGIPPAFADGVDNDHIYSPGTGLTNGLGGAFDVVFVGSGSSNSVSRSDHDHLGTSWDGNFPDTLAFGVFNRGVNGSAIHGQASAVSGGGTGVEGNSLAENGSGVAGYASGSGLEKRGVYGYVAGGGFGVFGFQDAKTDAGAGVRGYSISLNSRAAGVFGEISVPASGTDAAGVHGLNNSSGDSGYGVFGEHAAGGVGVRGTSYTGVGVGGYSSGRFGPGVRGEGMVGVEGLGFTNIADPLGSTGVYGEGTDVGVHGHYVGPFNTVGHHYGVWGEGVVGVVGEGVGAGGGIAGFAGSFGSGELEKRVCKESRRTGRERAPRWRRTARSKAWPCALSRGPSK